MSHYLIMYRPPRADFAESATPEELAVIERHLNSGVRNPFLTPHGKMYERSKTK